MNYSNKTYAACLTKRGLKYNETAINILWNRNQKLITAWYWEHDIDAGSTRTARLWRITSEIKQMTDALKKAYFDQVEINEQEKRFLDNSFIELSCSIACKNPNGTLVLFKNYLPGNIKCEYCGKPLTSREEKALDYELCSMGFYYK